VYVSKCTTCFSPFGKSFHRWWVLIVGISLSVKSAFLKMFNFGSARNSYVMQKVLVKVTIFYVGVGCNVYLSLYSVISF